MPDDAGIDIDMDTELASLQGTIAGVRPAAGQDGSGPDPEPVTVISGQIVGGRRTVPFLGKRFRVADKIGAMPLLKFSMYADMAVQDPKALAAMYAMIRDCIYPGTPGCGECGYCAPERCGECRACERAAGIEDDDLKPGCLISTPDETRCKSYDPGDWRAFEDHAIEQRAEAEDLMDVITKATELLAGRPTRPSSPSSGGRRGISAGSTARSSARRGRGSRR